MSSNQEQFTATSKALFESQIAAFRELSSKAVKGVEKVVALNSAAAKEYAEESSATVSQLFSAKDPQTFFALASEKAKLNAEKAATYGRRLTEIVSGINADFTKTTEAQIADSKNKVTALVDEVAKSAPTGSEQAVAMMKSAIDSASAGYEQLTKATKQAVETVEAQVVNTTEQFSHTAETVPHKTTHSTSKK